MPPSPRRAARPRAAGARRRHPGWPRARGRQSAAIPSEPLASLGGRAGWQTPRRERRRWRVERPIPRCSSPRSSTRRRRPQPPGRRHRRGFDPRPRPWRRLPRAYALRHRDRRGRTSGRMCSMSSARPMASQVSRCITRQEHRLDAHVEQVLNGRASTGTQAILQSHDADQVAPESDQEHGAPHGLQLEDLRLGGGDADALLQHQRAAADDQGLTARCHCCHAQTRLHVRAAHAVGANADPRGAQHRRRHGVCFARFRAGGRIAGFQRGVRGPVALHDVPGTGDTAGFGNGRPPPTPGKPASTHVGRCGTQRCPRRGGRLQGIRARREGPRPAPALARQGSREPQGSREALRDLPRAGEPRGSPRAGRDPGRSLRGERPRRPDPRTRGPARRALAADQSAEVEVPVAIVEPAAEEVVVAREQAEPTALEEPAEVATEEQPQTGTEEPVEEVVAASTDEPGEEQPLTEAEGGPAEPPVLAEVPSAVSQALEEPPTDVISAVIERAAVPPAALEAVVPAARPPAAKTRPPTPSSCCCRHSRPVSRPRFTNSRSTKGSR